MSRPPAPTGWSDNAALRQKIRQLALAGIVSMPRLLAPQNSAG